MIAPPIPGWMLDGEMAVSAPDGAGGFLAPVVVSGVRFERVQSASGDSHRCADAGGGKVFVDAVTSAGAFEVPVGSRVEIEGVSMFVRACRRVPGPRGEVHHWEVEVS